MKYNNLTKPTSEISTLTKIITNKIPNIDFILVTDARID